jgi:fructose-bisphosphate aldolase/2-amino-3,7-dideoxy-D-threo-hept-6-ulosonate synthase
LESGKQKRLKRIFREDKKTVIVPMDHGVTIGPARGITDMQETVSTLLAGAVDAFVMHKGIAKNVDTGTAGLIVHLSASTELGPDANNKVQVCSVEEALRLGADAVSVHINIGVDQEDQMLTQLGRVADDCDTYSLPLLAMMYPRGPRVQDQHGTKVVAHVARLGAELGADIVKTNYTGTIETFAEVIRGCCVPVVIAGGPKAATIKEVFEMVYDSIRAGGAGVSIGRNVFQHGTPALMAKALCALVHHGASVDEASRILEDSN